MSYPDLVIYTNNLPQGFPVNSGTSTQLSLVSTVGVLTISKETEIPDNYKLSDTLFAIVKLEDNQYIVIENRTDEYGIGRSIEEAQQDLLDSLVEYLHSLEKREKKLGKREVTTLQAIRDIINK